jgi:hypothetical protein
VSSWSICRWKGPHAASILDGCNSLIIGNGFSHEKAERLDPGQTVAVVAEIAAVHIGANNIRSGGAIFHAPNSLAVTLKNTREASQSDWVRGCSLLLCDRISGTSDPYIPWQAG